MQTIKKQIKRKLKKREQNPHQIKNSQGEKTKK